MELKNSVKVKTQEIIRGKESISKNNVVEEAILYALTENIVVELRIREEVYLINPVHIRDSIYQQINSVANQKK